MSNFKPEFSTNFRPAELTPNPDSCKILKQVQDDTLGFASDQSTQKSTRTICPNQFTQFVTKDKV